MVIKTLSSRYVAYSHNCFQGRCRAHSLNATYYWLIVTLTLHKFVSSDGLLERNRRSNNAHDDSVRWKKDKLAIAVRTFWRVSVTKVRLRSEHELLQDDSEAVDVSFLSSVDRSSCHTQQLRCCPQLITVVLKLVHLLQSNRLMISAAYYRVLL